MMAEVLFILESQGDLLTLVPDVPTSTDLLDQDREGFSYSRCTHTLNLSSPVDKFASPGDGHWVMCINRVGFEVVGESSHEELVNHTVRH